MSSRIACSIVIPTHRRPGLLPRAVQSALRACEDLGEVIVVSDHDPGTWESLAALSADPRLHIVANAGPRGASGARNHGVAAAQGEIILFLDDDDEIVADYPRRVLAVAQAHRASWGFSRHLIRTGPAAPLKDAPRTGRRQGAVGTFGGFRKVIAATSSGFWVRRDLFLDLGGFCPELMLDEDTDLCCRLVAAGHRPWYESESGMILNRDASVLRPTHNTRTLRGQYYLLTLKRNAPGLRGMPGGVAYLAFRAQRMLLRAGLPDLLPQVYREVPWRWLRLALRTKAWWDRGRRVVAD